ncbi:MAG: hypothetical protein KF821_01990 [Anaerolineales bacterium]|nr:hypothetical protein [Anaerolineales bacterium]
MEQREYKLDVYQVIDGTDNWPLVDTITGSSPEECLDAAEGKYGSNNEYHWTNPVETN